MSPMIPPAPQVPVIPEQQTGHSVSAKEGFDPATGLPLSSSESPLPPETVNPAIQRKIDSATGRGFRRDAPPTVASESGEHITLKGPNGVPVGCRYCGVNPCHGTSWIFEGEVRFKCDACGRKQKLGYLEEVSNRVKDELDGYNRADENRRRLWRDEDARREEERKRQLDEIARNPDSQYYGVLTNRGIVDDMFFS